MPQMLQYCGQRFQIFKRAGKTCSEVLGPTGVIYVSRRLHDTVHLEHRCDGRTYGGCQAGCLMFWKEAWLKPVGATESHQTCELLPDRAFAPGRSSCCTEDQILAATTYRGPDNDVRYSCQATQLMEFHHSPPVVGRPAVCRSLSLRQLFPEHCSKEHCLSALLLRYDGAFAASGCRIALAVRPVPIPLGRLSVPEEAGKNCSGPNHSQVRYGLKAGRTGAGEIVRADT